MKRRLKAILMAPIRLITWPFRKFRDFLNFEPEDTPTSEVFSRAFNEPGVLLDHLEALRKHMVRGGIVLAIAIGVSFAFAQGILDWLAQPIGGIDQLQAIEVTETIGTFMRVSLLTGFAVSLPFLLFELFSFVNPGLRRSERRLVLFAMPVAFVLFIGGMAFAYFVVLPQALPFLLNFLGVKTIPRPSNYVRFVMNLMFWIGVAFEFPLVIYVLAGLGVVNSGMLIRGWRLSVVGIAVIAAVATPTIDPVNMALVMAPMIVLYFLSIILAAIAGAGRRRRTSPSPSSQPTG